MANDPRITHLADQAAARTQEEEREQQNWDLHIRSTTAHAAQAEAASMYAFAKSRFWVRLAHAVTLVAVAAVVLAFLTAFGVTSW